MSTTLYPELNGETLEDVVKWIRDATRKRHDDVGDADKVTRDIEQAATDTTAEIDAGDAINAEDIATNAAAIALCAAKIQTGEGAGGMLETPEDGDYQLFINMPHGGTITSTTTDCVSGTCTATFKINTTALGGTANAVSSTEQPQAHSSNNVFAAGDNVIVTISSNAVCLKMSFMIKYTRTLI